MPAIIPFFFCTKEHLAKIKLQIMTSLNVKEIEERVRGQEKKLKKKRMLFGKKYSGSSEYLFTDIIFRPQGYFGAQASTVFNNKKVCKT